MIIGGFNKFRSALRTWLEVQTYTMAPEPPTWNEANNIYEELEKSSTLRVVVVPTSVPLTPGTRRQPQHNWRCRVHVLKRVIESDDAARMAAQDRLGEFVDEIESKLNDLKELDVAGRLRSIVIPQDTPRIVMDDVGAQKNIYWASVEVELIDA